ncbi:MAG TPA: class I SAM-dependent methyltransferase [Burkholderiaceae bacterium]|nr:class I SAM-dependent methyltransferase [Burkholderiaceae bacterium]
MELNAFTPPCRFCRAPLVHTFVDLGMSPLCQTMVESKQLHHSEEFFPLHVRICDQCFLVQLAESVSPARIFTEYAYFSSYVDTLVEAARVYSDGMISSLGLSAHSLVIELASNDGYLLQHFVARRIPVLGIEPAANVAAAAVAKGIPTLVKFFGTITAREVVAEHGKADLLLGNNVLAHVPDLNDFVGGMAILLKPDGVLTMEFPHLMRLMELNQFDTIYHEHFSYLNFTTVERVFAAHGLTLFDVEEISNHGGSLRIFARHAGDASKPVGARVEELRERETRAGLGKLDIYFAFAEKVRKTKAQLLEFLIDAKRRGKRIVGYGAPGKSVTLLNFCGIREDFVDYLVDRNPYKQGKYLPGVRIPIHAPEMIRETKPDYLLILPWNISDEVMKYTDYLREWGGQWVVPIPAVKVLS